MPVSLMLEHTALCQKIVEDGLAIFLCVQKSSKCSPRFSSDCSVFASYPVSWLNILALAQDPRNSYSRFLQLYTVSALCFSLDLYLLSFVAAMSYV